MSMDLVAFGFGLASVFGLIVGIFSVWNGRMTRREMAAVIQKTQTETQTLIREMQAETQALIREMRESSAAAHERSEAAHERSEAAQREMRESSEATHREALRILEKIADRVAR